MSIEATLRTVAWAIPLVVLGVMLLRAHLRKGSVDSVPMGYRLLELSSPASPEEAFARITAIGLPYRVDDADPARKIIILSSPVTLGSYGFFYPVAIAPQPTGCLIQIGIRSKAVQIGPLVGRAHRKCVDAIERQLGVPTARVA